KRLNEHVPKTMEEMMITTTAFIRGEASAASKKKGHASWKPQDQSKRHSSDKRTVKQKVTQSFERVREIAFPQLTTSNGTEGPLVIEAEMGRHVIHRMYIDGGSSMKILYEHCFNRLRPEIKSQMVPATTSLTGFSDAEIMREVYYHDWLSNPVMVKKYDGSWRMCIDFIDLNRACLHDCYPLPEIDWKRLMDKAFESQVGRNIEVYVDDLVVKSHTEAEMPSDMTGVPRSVVEHRPNIREGYTPVRQKKRGQAPERARVIQAEVQKLVDAGIIREVYYHDWLSNPVMVKKHDGSWRMCVDFTDLNRACPQDCYPLPEIDWKMPFGLKNAGATYQRLMDKAFESQVGRNIEVYVVDLVVKSHTEAEMVRDIEETFRTLRKINMKLNPKKCSFGLAEGVFLGYVITPEGIKACSDKTAAVLQSPSPQTVKEVQSLNGKLASLNRFLSKSAKKSLPLFQTLKKCIKKSDFRWTAKAEQAFQQLKQHLSYLPLLVAPNPQEELITYLSATYGAVSAVLMTERGTTQTPIYFISRALQGPELNYSPMEKLVLSLVFVAKRLRRYFQAHPITVITDQPIKVMTRPDAAGRLQKWSIMLGEHNITYRPRTSVKGQILADFLTEMPGDVPQAAPAAATQDESWTLFTDGSSCVDGSGAGLILTNPEGVEFTYALRFQFAASNNEAEYEALVAGLRIATDCKKLSPGRIPTRLLSNDASHAVAGGKLGAKWEGPYEVTEALGNGAYRLRCSDGTVLPRTWNVANLKRCYL
nr:reverse transcriptase domain-containing protein [Tanacetum cinerariifolium]